MSEPRPISTDQNTWVLTDANINDLQVASIDRLIERCKHAHHVDLLIRINGKDEHVQADWFKHLKRVVEPADQSRLMSFYDARSKDELIERLLQHVESLQAKLPQAPSMRPDRPREG